tara:strand:- start:182 stop:793 length:612 start_codon:yes stop_codon:yes gene_type:complete
MSLWGNKDLVYDDGTVAVNLETKKVVGTGATFNTSGLINVGNVITVGAGATFGYAVITAVDSATVLSIDGSSGFAVGVTTVDAGASYAISAEPAYAIGQYGAPEAKAAADATKTAPDGYTKLHTSSVFGVDTAEQQETVDDASQFHPAHAGWVGITTYIDNHGNLRVKSEVLVAMGKDAAGNGGIQNDADSSILADDTEFPDS